MQLDVGVQVADRQLVAVHDALAGEFDVGVHGPPALGAEFLHRQHLVRRLAGGLAAGPLLVVGVGADQRAEVDHAQLVGLQLAGELRPRLAVDEGEAAVEVAVADLAVEVPVAEHRAAGVVQLGVQAAVGGVGRGIGQGDAGKRVEMGHAGAFQLQAQVEGAEVQRVGEGADDAGAGAAGAHVGLHRERLAGLLQRQHATDLALAVERQALVLAPGFPAEHVVLGRRGVGAGGLAGQLGEGHRLAEAVHQQFDARFQLAVVEADAALVEADGADLQLPRRGLRGFLLAGRQLEVPVGAAVGQAQKVGAGAGEGDLRDDDALPQQRQRGQAELHAVQAGEALGAGLAGGPVGIAEGQVAGLEAWPRHPGAPAVLAGLAGPDHPQVAVDGEGAVERGGDLFIEQGFGAIPVEGGDEHHAERQQAEQGSEGPERDFSAARHAELLVAASVMGCAMPARATASNSWTGAGTLSSRDLADLLRSGSAAPAAWQGLADVAPADNIHLFDINVRADICYRGR
ncbi:hypothetical protein D3C76_798880 [compost metagenome]